MMILYRACEFADFLPPYDIVIPSVIAVSYRHFRRGFGRGEFPRGRNNYIIQWHDGALYLSNVAAAADARGRGTGYRPRSQPIFADRSGSIRSAWSAQLFQAWIPYAGKS